MRWGSHFLRRSHGFSLLELSVVLAVISLISGVGMSMAGGALKAADRVTTQERLNTIKMALDSYVKTYGYLPCPASRIQLPSSATFGVESRAAAATVCTAAGSGVVNTGSAWVGAVPVRNLGLPDSYAADGWGNKLTYAVTAFQAHSHVGAFTSDSAITIRSGVKSATPYNVASQRMISSYSAAVNNGSGAIRLTVPTTVLDGLGGARVYVLSTTPSTGYKGSYVAAIIDATHLDLVGSTYSATDVGTIYWLVTNTAGANTAYAVVSHGPDGRGAFPLNGSSVPTNKLCNDLVTASVTSPAPCPLGTDSTCNDIENCDNNAVFFDTTYNDNAIPAQYFDDYIVWGSTERMREPVHPSLYATCPTGTCEAWCAKCDINYPSGNTTAPPTTITAPALCRKVITSNATDCKAACFWSGTTAGRYQKCP